MAKPFVVLAIDALEYGLVEKFGCSNLKQEAYGKTDISEFSQPRTMVLWSSFLSCKNREKEIVAKGDREMWSTRIPLKETFLSSFSSPAVIDLPGYSYEKAQHDAEREMLKKFFDIRDEKEKQRIRENYNKNTLEHHKRIAGQFFRALKEDHDIVIGYFSAADVVGHLNFGNSALMKMIYMEMDGIAARVRAMGMRLLVLSDHGMQAVGVFGDHSGYGFWSANFPVSNRRYKITDFGSMIRVKAKHK